jgi:hypothetical protein
MSRKRDKVGRIAERAHPGIRRAEGENRQGSLHGSVLAQASEGCRNADRTDLRPDDRGPVSVPEESRGRLFPGVATWPEKLRGRASHRRKSAKKETGICER